MRETADPCRVDDVVQHTERDAFRGEALRGDVAGYRVRRRQCLGNGARVARSQIGECVGRVVEERAVVRADVALGLASEAQGLLRPR